MREIIKGPEPPSLTAHRQRPHCYYANYEDKDDLRRALVAEQRGICCYCMTRIRSEPASMKIEHWQCQAHHCGEQLNYRNLLGTCLGGPKQPVHRQHCDTRKGDQDLKWNPANPAHHIETRIRYWTDGSIHADDAEFDTQLDQVLNLNLSLLRNNRKRVLDAVLDWWKQEKSRIGGRVPRDRFVRERDKHWANHGQLSPFCQVAVWWIEQKLAGIVT